MDKIKMLKDGLYQELKTHLEETKDYYLGDDSVITYAVKNFDNVKVKEILDAGFHVNTRDKSYNTAVMYAAAQDNIELMEYLVSIKALTRLKNLENQTALDIAVMNNSLKTSRFLLSLYEDYSADKALAIEILSNEGVKFKNAMHLINTSSYEWVKVYKRNVIIKIEEFFFVYWNENIPFAELYMQIGEKAKVFFIVDDNVKEYFESKYKFAWIASCDHYHLDDISKLDELRMEFSDYTVDDVDYIFDNYPELYDYDRDYVKLQVQVGVSTAIKEDGKLIACAFCHDDGSLGGLFVIDEKRNQGYAKQISSKIIREVIDKRDGVYVDIKKDNLKSKNLSEGIGFKRVRSTNWFEVM